MNRGVFAEGILLISISVAAMAEGFILYRYKDPYTLFDPIGPGLYILALGILLLAVGFAHLAVNWWWAEGLANINSNPGAPQGPGLALHFFGASNPDGEDRCAAAQGDKRGAGKTRRPVCGCK